jgi:D-glycero-beta-D-manno-heptose 1-phosphate adenylyltransferase
MLDYCRKIISIEQLPKWREELRRKNRVLVVTNGCFDLLHMGHVTYLQAARNLGDMLLVGVNGDAAVRALKGQSRPINTERDRAGVLAALESVDGVYIFHEVRAVQFLELAQPDIYVKGGDYTLETLNPDEKQAIETIGGRIQLIPLLPGKSTTATLNRMNK